MDVLTDDHEREEVVRKWWHENWLSLTVGVVIAIGAMVGYRQYQSYQNDTSAKYAYEMSTLQTKLVLNPTNTTADAQKFIKEHEDIYGSLLALDLSSIEAKQGNYDKALENRIHDKTVPIRDTYQRLQKAQKERNEVVQYKIGDSVTHPKFGDGIVM